MVVKALRPRPVELYASWLSPGGFHRGNWLKRGRAEEQSAGPVHILLQLTSSDTIDTCRLLGMLRLVALERPLTVDHRFAMVHWSVHGGLRMR
jgi:hypothetical protein